MKNLMFLNWLRHRLDLDPMPTEDEIEQRRKRQREWHAQLKAEIQNA